MAEKTNQVTKQSRNMAPKCKQVIKQSKNPVSTPWDRKIISCTWSKTIITWFRQRKRRQQMQQELEYLKISTVSRTGQNKRLLNWPVGRHLIRIGFPSRRPGPESSSMTWLSGLTFPTATSLRVFAKVSSRPVYARLRSEAGMATVEFALTLPAVIAVMVLSISGLGAGAAKIQACAEARNAARAIAIGDQSTTTNTILSKEGDYISATTQRSISGLGWTGFTLKCQVKIYNEPVIENG